MIEEKEVKLKKLASEDDYLAQYYLGKYYIEEKGNVDVGLYWLLKSRYGKPSYSSVLVAKLSRKYPNRIRAIEKDLVKEGVGRVS